MPEDLPTPEKSIQQLQRDEQLRIERKRQPSLFDNTASQNEDSLDDLIDLFAGSAEVDHDAIYK